MRKSVLGLWQAGYGVVTTGETRVSLFTVYIK